MHRATANTTMTARRSADDRNTGATAAAVLARSLIASFTAKVECIDDNDAVASNDDDSGS